MKSRFMAMAVLMFIFTVVSGWAGDTLRQIAVTGTVETKIAPDQILWRVTLTDTDKDMHKAIKNNDDKIKAIVALRKKLGVSEEDMNTGIVSIQREYERDLNGSRGDFKHFRVQRNVTIRQRDLKRFDEFLDMLVACSEMEMSFSFESSKMLETRAETRLKALKAARDKAQAMAEVVDAHLGKVLTIDENKNDGPFVGSNMISNNAFVQSSASADLATEKFIPGAISVQVTVYATFELK